MSTAGKMIYCEGAFCVKADIVIDRLDDIYFCFSWFTYRTPMDKTFMFNSFLLIHRTSGVTDHLAQNDEHALSIARSIVAGLNWKQTTSAVRRFICLRFLTCCVILHA